MNKIIPLSKSVFLDVAAKSYKIDLAYRPEYKVQQSILNYDIKPIPEKPYFDFSDRNNFEAIYKTKNRAFYEAVKNTALSQLYNPFSLHKQL
ncbi:hypothetical protein [Nonlabens antarcticus]|uniref:hypothetical protein n=1 Tax=Nonlabens antarcticus TaxID=392714 RepID=UPI00189136A5|nr:hypothetical protein [Nonlabens antarcticus]